MFLLSFKASLSRGSSNLLLNKNEISFGKGENSHSYDVVFLLPFVFSVVLSFLVPVFCVRFVVNGDPCLIYFNVVYYQDSRS